MNSPTSTEFFDANYYDTSCGRKYARDEHWLGFFDRIAERIASEIQPASVLDAGCAFGFLVEGLRSRGIAAFGIDVSEHAIASVHPSVRPYCSLGSITTPFPQRYDLIVSIEVLEHMPPDESRAALVNLCQSSDDILFSSTPFDKQEATHFNVQPPEYWAEQFAEHGFFRDVDFDASFVTPWAVRFRRRREPLRAIIGDYERLCFRLQSENWDLQKLVLETRNASTGQRYESGDNEALQSAPVALEGTPGYALLQLLQRARAELAPPESRRDRLLDKAWLLVQRARKR